MAQLSPSIQEVANLLSNEEVIRPSSPLYPELTQTWAAQKNLKPQLVVQPRDLKALSRLLAFLGQSELDFAIRCGGFGSTSAKDVLVSMSAFDSFEFDKETETVTVGAGQIWTDVNAKMELFAAGYAGIVMPQALSVAFLDVLVSAQSTMFFPWSWRLNTWRRYWLAVVRVRSGIRSTQHA